ncbi:ABC transporter ATP-binding protein [Paenibacillus xylaniclasticus]|uniref:ABC transporter ATP-binding protein n=1 Tax=Paenibacillus xylaniclasticus TaxID=588083 RepID=UPI000FD7F760|nr:MULTISPECIES: ABC transporter ATP-binding protein [Paenibacillus]GFN31163.1 ABC transporter ATP-binding protein [Paenibacillus curdlanolyticus]
MNRPALESNITVKSYRWALAFLLPYKKQITLLMVCSVLGVAGEMLTPKVIQYIIDHTVKEGNFQAFYGLLSLLVAVNLLMLIAKNARNLLQRAIGAFASRDIQRDIFNHLRKLGFAHYERHPAGETLSMFNSEVVAVQRIYNQYLPSIVDNMLYVVAAVSLLVGINGWLTLIMVPTFGLYYLFGPYFERKAAHYGNLSGQGRIAFNQKIYESVSGFREFRAFGAQRWYHERTYAEHKAWSRDYLLAATFGFARGSFRRFTFYVGAIAVFLIGYYMLKHNYVTLGGFVAFTLLYMSTMFKLTLLVTQLTEQRLIIHQTAPLYKFMHKPIEIEDPDDPIEPAQLLGSLTFEGVEFGYPGQPPVIRGFDLNIQPGEKIAFVGPSGGGKTTLFKLVGRFYDPTSGTVRLDGIPLHSMSLERLRNSIGYVFQETYLFGSSVKDNIRFGKPDATDEEVIAAAKAAYAHDFIMELPEGYETEVGERGIKLSGGQKQRIAIARMFIKQPVVILLDEATSSLDNVSEREVQQALDRLLVGRTTIAIAHRLSTVKHFDRIVYLHEGRAAEVGSYEELMARRGLLYALELGQTGEEVREEVRAE